jgi:pimeloyl-ACP methyl ester carboxylesterase
MDRFVDEIGTVRDALGLDRVHLLGHSWGGYLAMEYALGRQPGLASLVLASACASLPAFAEETRRLKESLPAVVQKTIDEYEAADTTDAEAYGEATMAYLTQWICRLDLPWPDRVMRSMNNLSKDVYRTMQGPEWNVTGNLKNWEVTDRRRFHFAEESSKDIAVAVRLLDRCEVGAVLEDHPLGAADASDQGPDQRLCHLVVPTGCTSTGMPSSPSRA